MRGLLLLALFLPDATPVRREFDPRNCGLVKTIVPGVDPHSVAFSPDGRWLAVVCGDATARVYEVSGWRECFKLEGVESGIAFSPDGKTLATGGKGSKILLWDVPSGRQKAAWGVDANVHALAFSPSGHRLLSGEAFPWVGVWDVETGKRCASPEHAGMVVAVVFSPDGKRAASASWEEGGVMIWKTTTWEQEKALPGLGKPVRSLFFSRDGCRLITGGADGAVKMWNVEKVELEWTVQDEQGDPVFGAVFTRDDRYVVAAGGATVRIWDARTGASVASLAHHTGAVTGLAFHPEGRTFATVGRDRQIKIWGSVTGGMARVRAKGFLGVSPDPNVLMEGGVVIGDVIPGTAADKAGLKAGDVIRKVDGAPIADMNRLVDQIGGHFEGDELEFTVEREGVPTNFKIKLGKRSEPVDR